MSGGHKTNSNTNGNLGIIGRGDFLFTAGACAIIVGLLFPLSGRVFDVLLIFSISLTVAVLIVTFSARRALEVSGFPLLIVLTTSLRTVLSTASVRLIFSGADSGTIIDFFGDFAIGNSEKPAILIFAIAAIICFVVICKAVKSIRRTAAEFTCDIAPVRQIGINSDLDAGLIDENQALSLRRQITGEVGFFVAMSGAARFILCIAVIELFIAIVNITASVTIPAATSITSALPPRTYANLAVGSGMMIQIPALLAALSCGLLVRKSWACAVANNTLDESQHSQSKRIKIVATEVRPGTSTQLQHDDTISYVETKEKAVAKDADWLDEKSEKDNLGMWSWKEIKERNRYDAIAKLIEDKSGKDAGTILMAAENVEELGVTVPVNIAIHLAKKGRKCLLIDLDSARNAVSKVFDIETDGPGRGEIAACIKNLWIWPASNLGKGDATEFKNTICDLQSRYDRLIIYAPNVKALDGCKTIADSVGSAILFGAEDRGADSAVSSLGALLISCGCEILEPESISPGSKEARGKEVKR